MGMADFLRNQLHVGLPFQKNEMQGPVVSGRVLAARSVTPVRAPLGGGVARWRSCACVAWRPVSNRGALG
jgi:hypothetical protein